MVKDKNLHLLKEHCPITREALIEYHENKLVMGDAGREIFLVQGGQRHGFPDFDTFVKMKFKSTQVTACSGSKQSCIVHAMYSNEMVSSSVCLSCKLCSR